MLRNPENLIGFGTEKYMTLDLSNFAADFFFFFLHIGKGYLILQFYDVRFIIEISLASIIKGKIFFPESMYIFTTFIWSVQNKFILTHS